MERFYSKVNAIVHNRNLLKDSIIVEDKAEAEQYKKALRLKDNKVRINAVRAKNVRELRASKAAKEAEVNVAPADGVLVVEDLPEVPKRDNPKKWNKRPPFWESIVEYYIKGEWNGGFGTRNLTLTYMKTIEEIIIPYKNRFVRRCK
jgi:hypothetical protein